MVAPNLVDAEEKPEKVPPFNVAVEEGRTPLSTEDRPPLGAAEEEDVLEPELIVSIEMMLRKSNARRMLGVLSVNDSLIIRARTSIHISMLAIVAISDKLDEMTHRPAEIPCTNLSTNPTILPK